MIVYIGWTTVHVRSVETCDSLNVISLSIAFFVPVPGRSR
jgi:hypothetical protein